MIPSTPALGDRLAAAFSFALKLHRGQVRKTAESGRDGPAIPYVAHLMTVAALVLEHGGDEDEAIAALLHDGPEDQGGQETLDDIHSRFGRRVAGIVEACSDTFETPKPEWRPRKELYLDHLRKTTSPSVFLISVADKVHNLRSILEDYRRIGDRLWERFIGKRDGTLWYYAELLKVCQDKAPARCAGLVEEMERTYRALATAAGGSTKNAEDDPDETQPFPASLLDERWEWGPPVEAIRAALAEEPEDRETVTEVMSGVAEAAAEDARRMLAEEIAAFVESRATDPAEGERLAHDIRSAFSCTSAP